MTRLKRRRFQQGRTASVMVDMMDTDPAAAAFPHTLPLQVGHVVTSLVFLSDKSVYTDISYRESLVYLLLSNLFLYIRNTAQQICNRELVRQLLQTCIIAFSDTSLWQNYTAF